MTGAHAQLRVGWKPGGLAAVVAGRVVAAGGVVAVFGDVGAAGGFDRVVALELVPGTSVVVGLWAGGRAVVAAGRVSARVDVGADVVELASPVGVVGD